MECNKKCVGISGAHKRSQHPIRSEQDCWHSRIHRLVLCCWPGNFVWFVGFESRSPRPQRRVLITRLEPQHINSNVDEGVYTI